MLVQRVEHRARRESPLRRDQHDTGGRRRLLQGLKAFAGSPGQCGLVWGREERHVGPEAHRGPESGGGMQPDTPGRQGQVHGRSGVGAAAAQAGPYGDALGEHETQVRQRRVSGTTEVGRGPQDEVVFDAPIEIAKHFERVALVVGRGFDREIVMERQLHEDRSKRVVAIVPSTRDRQRQVDLRRRRFAQHAHGNGPSSARSTSHSSTDSV